MSLKLSDLPHLPFGTPRSLIRFPGGFSNHNYVLTTDSGDYRLRVPQRPIQLRSIMAEKRLLQWVSHKSALPVPHLYVFTMGNDTHVSVFPFIQAEPHQNLTETLVRSMGNALAEYHQAVVGYQGALPWPSLPESFNLRPLSLRTLGDVCAPQIDLDAPECWPSVEKLHDHMVDAAGQLQTELFMSLPHLACHGDFAPANVLVSNERVVGIIDFECSRWAPRISDVATGLLALKQNDGYVKEMMEWFLGGYQSIVPVTENELRFLPYFERLRSVETAKRHLINVIAGQESLNVDLVMYWARIV